MMLGYGIFLRILYAKHQVHECAIRSPYVEALVSVGGVCTAFGVAFFLALLFFPDFFAMLQLLQ